MQTIKQDWHGKPCPSASFRIWQENQFWIFSVQVNVPADITLPAQPGEYFEGLWEQDVAEWFIANPQTGHYIELNLAANGAWWLMAFSQPRVRNETLLQTTSLAGVNTQHQMTATAWQAELRLPQNCLQNLLGEGQWTHNVCFILGQQPRQYLSMNQLASLKPDFHLPDEFTALPASMDQLST